LLSYLLKAATATNVRDVFIWSSSCSGTIIAWLDSRDKQDAHINFISSRWHI
jgi:hypothetical protein